MSKAAASHGHQIFAEGPMRLLIAPASLLVVVVLVLPMAILFRISLNEYSPTQLMVEALTLRNYVSVFTDSYYQLTLLNTLLVSSVCTALALPLAFPAAYWLARLDSRYKSLVVILTLFPLMIGGVVRTAGWMALVGTDGAINVGLMRLGIISAPVQMMYTNGMVVVGLLALALPYMILTLSATIESIPRHLEEAATNLGANAMTRFFRVILPLAWPGVAASSVLVFIMSMNAYSTPRLLGGPQFRMMSPAIYEQFVRGHNWPAGAALAFILLAATSVLIVIGTVYFGRRARRSAT